MLPIFANLISIGDSNLSLISSSAPAWAFEISKRMIRSNNHLIMLWVMDVCDGLKDLEDPMGDNWRAPAFVLMKPARSGEYIASKAWERLDANSSVNAILAFKQDYVISVEEKLKRLAGEAEVHRAIHGAPSVVSDKDKVHVENAKRSTPVVEEKKVISSKRPAKKNRFDAARGELQKMAQEMRNKTPGISDLQISKALEGKNAAKGLRSETIRKKIR